MSKIIRKITKPINKLGPIGDILTAVALTAMGQPHLIPVVSGLKTYGATGNIGAGIAAGAGSYLGGKFGGKVFGDMGTVGGMASNVLGPETASSVFGGIGSGAGNSAASSIFNAPLNAIAGSYAGNALGQGLVGAEPYQEKPKGPAGFSPSRAGDMETPASLRAFGSLSPDQQSSNLATQGVYGGGLGPEEQQYFLNLVNRQLIPEQGGIQDKGSLGAIQNSYLQQLGISGDNSNDLLEAISKWKRAA